MSFCLLELTWGSVSHAQRNTVKCVTLNFLGEANQLGSSILLSLPLFDIMNDRSMNRQTDFQGSDVTDGAP